MKGAGLKITGLQNAWKHCEECFVQLLAGMGVIETQLVWGRARDLTFLTSSLMVRILLAWEISQNDVRDADI